MEGIYDRTDRAARDKQLGGCGWTECSHGWMMVVLVMMLLVVVGRCSGGSEVDVVEGVLAFVCDDERREL